MKGDQGCESVAVDLRIAVNEFNSTLSNFGHSVGFRTFELVERLAPKLRIQVPDIFVELRQDFAIVQQRQVQNLSHSAL